MAIWGFYLADDFRKITVESMTTIGSRSESLDFRAYDWTDERRRQYVLLFSRHVDFYNSVASSLSYVVYIR